MDAADGGQTLIVRNRRSRLLSPLPMTPSAVVADLAEVDRAGVRILVSTGGAYDLFLSRELKHATIVRTATAKDVVDLFVAEKLDVAAGVRPALEADARRVPGLRLLPDRFMAETPGLRCVKRVDWHPMPPVRVLRT